MNLISESRFKTSAGYLKKKTTTTPAISRTYFTQF